MNPEAQAEVERILKLNPQDLTTYDIAFLNARRDYLNDEQKRVFASVLIKDGVQSEELDENGVYIAKKDRK